jgi:simple sugar transport system ATP-binding protein
MADTLLELRQITKQFPGVTANDHVSFDLRAGEVHALVGENGAGKTTLMKILYGLYRPDSGSIAVEGRELSIRGPRDAISRGIGMVHQHFMLFPPFTVLENVVIGEETHRAGVLSTRAQHSRVQAIMEENGISVPLDARVEELPVGLQQRVEILKILFRGARILIFDEPTAVLTPQESNELFRTFRALTAHGKGIIFITHKLDEVLATADRITVIRQGRIVRTMDRAGVTKPMIAELMVGKPVLMEVDRPPREAGHTVLEVRDLKVRNPRGLTAVDGISFSVKAGEVYGIAGVEGNGQSELVHAIAEGVGIESGDILLEGANARHWSVRKRREEGIAHIPEDRLKYGLLLPFSIATNLTLGRHDKPPFATRLQLVNTRAVRESAQRIIAQYDIRTPSCDTPANALSGGNQQKAVVARELSCEPKLLLASQPTRGVDIGATEFIHRQIMKARSEGKAVLLVSADLDELLALSDRVGVIFKGKIIREFPHEQAVREEVGLAMTGEKSDVPA